MSTCVHIRPLEDGETGPVLAVLDGLRARSRELRFMSPKFRLTVTDLCHLTHADGRDRVALVAELPDGRPIGIARFVRSDTDTSAADVAGAVVDRWQRRGIGRQLARALADYAHSVAVRRFTVDMVRENAGALRLIHHAGNVRPVSLDAHSAEYEVTLSAETADNSVDV